MKRKLPAQNATLTKIERFYGRIFEITIKQAYHSFVYLIEYINGEWCGKDKWAVHIVKHSMKI